MEIPDCNICYEEYDTEEYRPMVGKCGHTFCEDCVKRLRSTDCPKCRKKGAFRSPTVNYILMEMMEEEEKEIVRAAVAQLGAVIAECVNAPINWDNIDYDIYNMDGVDFTDMERYELDFSDLIAEREREQQKLQEELEQNRLVDQMERIVDDFERIRVNFNGQPAQQQQDFDLPDIMHSDDFDLP